MPGKIINTYKKCANTCHYIVLAHGIIGFGFSLLALSSCDFVKVENGQIDGGVPFNGTAGLLRYGNGTSAFDVIGATCTFYDPDYVTGNGTLGASILFSIAAPFFAFLAIILHIAELFCLPHPIFHMISSVDYTIAWMLSCFTFLFLGAGICPAETGHCTFSFGGIFTLASIGVYFINGVMWCCMPPPITALIDGGIRVGEDIVIGDDFSTESARQRAKDQLEFTVVKTGARVARMAVTGGI